MRTYYNNVDKVWLWSTEQINPLPFITRWKVYSPSGQWVATFRDKETASKFVENAIVEPQAR